MGGAQSKAGAEPKSSVSFRINGTSVTVNNVNPLLTLNGWLRAQPGLAGTKKMCGEGGCGCCVVAATRVNPATQKEATIAINSVCETSHLLVNFNYSLQSRVYNQVSTIFTDHKS